MAGAEEFRATEEDSSGSGLAGGELDEWDRLGMH
jgi:hypothetical protein